MLCKIRKKAVKKERNIKFSSNFQQSKSTKKQLDVTIKSNPHVRTLKEAREKKKFEKLVEKQSHNYENVEYEYTKTKSAFKDKPAHKKQKLAHPNAGVSINQAGLQQYCIRTRPEAYLCMIIDRAIFLSLNFKPISFNTTHGTEDRQFQYP